MVRRCAGGGNPDPQCESWAQVRAAPRKLLGVVDVIPTMGHSSSHHSLRFDHEGHSILIAGDSVATRDFWRDRRSYYNAVDPAQGARTMDVLAKIASRIVPGHDNYFEV